MAITTEMIKDLRERTGAGIMDSKRALEEAGGNVEKAVDLLRQHGLAKAGKKASRTANQGVITPYVHSQGRICAMVELNCETDFVARTDNFKQLAYDIAMQVAAMSPRFVSADAVTEDDWAELEREFGDRDTATKAVVLLEQSFIKDAKQTINDLVRSAIAVIGENIVVRRFERFEVGELADAEAADDTEA